MTPLDPHVGAVTTVPPGAFSSAGVSTISEIKEWCYHEGKTFWEYVSDCEGPEIWDYLDTVT